MTEALATLPRRDVHALILDAAETQFAEHGFDGATTRAIAERAGVNLGLIHYHFTNKELLFERVVARRVDAINGRRAALLDALAAHGQAPVLEEIYDALIRPVVELDTGTGANSSTYARIVVQIASGMDARSTRLTSRYFDAIARRFIAAIDDALPDLGRENAVWSYMHAISIGMFLIARTGRVGVLSDGLCREDDPQAMIARAVAFVSAGTRALVNSPHATKLTQGGNT